MAKRNVILFSFPIILLCLRISVYAEPVYWEANGHYYERIDNAYITWDEACADAAGRSYLGVPGHLITITSAAEQQFLADHSMFPTSIPDRYWIGGYQPSGSPEPDGNWQWITGEAWSYSNWSAKEPNNQGSEDVAHICQGGVWNDLHRNNIGYTGGYYVEYPVPVVSEPQQPDVISFPEPATVTSASNVVYMVHGWNDSSNTFTTPRDSEDASLLNTNMKANIESALSGDNDWDILTYDWSDYAKSDTLAPTEKVKRAAESHGRALARSILNNPNYNKDTGKDGNVHLIGHSLGGCVINEAARYLYASSEWNGQVQLTFLDAYTPDGWEKTFGKEATWAEHYYHDGVVPNTQDDFAYAHNVDVTELLDDPGIPDPSENHKWPLRWYDSTIGESSGDGFPTSLESLGSDGIWLAPILYPYLPAESISNIQTVNPVDQTINTSPTGTINVSSDFVTLGTGSPVWINLALNVEEVANFLEFSYEFTSEADGLLSVYIDDILLGTYYEKNALNGLQSSGRLFLEENLEPGIHVLAFRVDPLSDETSTISLSGIQTGHFSIVPEPSGLALIGMCLFVFLMCRCFQKQS